MTDAYRRLREGMPEPDVNNTDCFHADSKKVNAKDATLSRANAMVTQQKLDTALASLSSRCVEGGQCLSVMDELRDVLVESITLLEQQFVGSSLSLPRIPARALDQSLGGYRMSWDNANKIRAEAGEIVGMTVIDENEEPDWMVGVVRWLRYEMNGGLSAGVELLARRSSALGVHIQIPDVIQRAPLRGIELWAPDASERSFLTQGTLDANAASIEIVHGHQPFALNARATSETLIAGVDVLINAGDYTVLRELRSDSVAEVQEGIEA